MSPERIAEIVEVTKTRLLTENITVVSMLLQLGAREEAEIVTALVINHLAIETEMGMDNTADRERLASIWEEAA